MTYIKNGVVVHGPEPWTVWRIVRLPADIFWAVVAIFTAFWTSMFGVRGGSERGSAAPCAAIATHRRGHCVARRRSSQCSWR